MRIGYNKGESLGKWAAIANGAVLANAIILVIASVGFLGAFSRAFAARRSQP